MIGILQKYSRCYKANKSLPGIVFTAVFISQCAWIIPSPARKDAQRVTKAMMVVFLDCYLKNDQVAKRFLNLKYANSLTGKVVKTVKWYEK